MNLLITCRRCSNYIFILDLTPGFNELGKDNCKTRQETFEFWNLVSLMIEILMVDTIKAYAIFYHLSSITDWDIWLWYKLC